ncbi:MAG: type II toxin-antitoxin system HicB family antitoxin [Syntrophobacteraceae bacterium]
MISSVENEQADDGRWLAEVLELPGALTYGSTVQRPSVKCRH